MRKNPRKLSLSRETVLNLQGEGLRRIAGGASNVGRCSAMPCVGLSGAFGTCGCETSNGPAACLCDPPGSDM